MSLARLSWQMTGREQANNVLEGNFKAVRNMKCPVKGS